MEIAAISKSGLLPIDETKIRKKKIERRWEGENKEGGEKGEKERNNSTAKSASLPLCGLAHSCRKVWLQHHLISSLRI